MEWTEGDQIYTYCGTTLIAINPYKNLSIYSKEYAQAYINQVPKEIVFGDMKGSTILEVKRR